ncbi:uncharacterized protein DUF4307 [Actinomadura pelletieri DSM 43383]|uniref:Uncharacterized protein DUF4307 n=1 Tax=Actinomadura pelletieri DSM 43383 TaxID=1120940 RepID=A0A495QIQ3_9ACTN|nr:DUF4307 domain-containing protein [Actinomadura pelletieri]RKS72023.1 uncharacterized protein DUF4307 [Actinomadura pelletieri DSM 43383]
MTTSAPDAAASPQSRGGRLGLVVIGIVTALAAGGFGIIAAYAGQTPGIVAQTVTYDIADTSVVVNYSVAKGKGDEVRCTVDAFDKNFAVLDAQEVAAPAGKSSVDGTVTLRTTRRATGARIHACRTV